MFSSYAGELAALGTATLWAVSSIAFTISGQRVGSLVVNRWRLLLALLLVGGTHWLVYGSPIPQAEPFRWGWFAVSAFFGLVIGDSLLFRSFVLLGTRVGMLLWSLSPIFGALIAWVFLGERLALSEVVAMAVALAGMAWVILERRPRQVELPRRLYVIGILAGVGAAGSQAAGLVLAKFALSDGYSPLSAVVIRMLAAVVLMWIVTALQGQTGVTLRKLREDPGASGYIMVGAILGPFLGVWLSLIAVQLGRVGIAATLMAMTPVLSLPLVRLVYHEHVSRRAVLGTLIAMAGVAMIIVL